MGEKDDINVFVPCPFGVPHYPDSLVAFMTAEPDPSLGAVEAEES